MTANNNILILIILINTVTGFLIKLSNPGRSQNKQFFHLSLALTTWMLCVLYIMNAKTSYAADILIRLATIASATFPLLMGTLLQSICHPTWSTAQLIKKFKVVGTLMLLVSAICLTPLFMEGVVMPSADNPTVKVAEPQYNFGFFLFTAYSFLALIYMIISAIHASLNSTGLMKVELQYVLLGVSVMFVSGFFISLILPLLTKTTQVQQYGPASVIFMNLIIAYGIATRRILDVGTVIRKLASYLLLTIYLIAVYMVTWFVAKFLLFSVLPNPSWPAHIVSALSVAFTMSSAHGKLQLFANKMIATHTVDIPSLIKKASAICHSVTTYDALVHNLSNLLDTELGSNDVRILLPTGSQYKQHQPNNIFNDSIVVGFESEAVKILKETKETVSQDSLIRSRQTPLTRAALEELKSLDAKLAVGVFSKGNLIGIILLGERQGGRIYSRTEQDALQILCSQFAVALENAQLYTEVQDSKIRNEIMLDQLVSGVIVANPDLEITLFNHEAQRITGIKERDAVNQDISNLPKPIARALEGTLNNKAGERNVEARLFEQDEMQKSLSIRMGTTYLLGHDRKPMGALLVFTDLTELKSLEEQVRRSDQLSSVGTLAAGMAHEIKNPLVTIKTFTQLLPERYADDDFRQDFSSLVAHEVSRIDGIVNELLSFSKPTKPHLIPMNLHDVIGQILKLTHEQMAQKNIVVNDTRTASKNRILGDSKLLSQAVINLTLNAVDAIGKDGTITIGSTNCTYRFANGEGPDQSAMKECIRIQISDSGQGIAPDHIKKIFDPFFTRKSEGTGMGLSVAHGIIQEHNAVIDVESESGKGTTFYIYIPVIEEEVA